MICCFRPIKYKSQFKFRGSMTDSVSILSFIVYLNRGVAPAHVVTTDFNPLNM